MLVVSYNPGYQNILKSLKPSTRQRFVAIEFDFPPAAVEAEVVAPMEPGLARALRTARRARRPYPQAEGPRSRGRRLDAPARLLPRASSPAA
jgi:MoxR-like ATPase